MDFNELLAQWRFACEDCYLRVAANFKADEDRGEYHIIEVDGEHLTGSEWLVRWAAEQRVLANHFLIHALADGQQEG